MDSLVGRNDGGGCGGSGRRRRQRSGERGRDPGKGARARESEGERQGGAWRPGEASSASRKESGKQEVVGALGRAPRLGPSGEEEDDRGGSGDGLGRFLQRAAQVGAR